MMSPPAAARRPSAGVPWLRRVWGVLLALVLLTVAAEAHVVQQIFVKFSTSPETWRAEVTMDAGYAWPALRDDPASPQPTLQWLESRTAEEWATLRSESELLLRRHLEFSGGGAVLAWTCGFPDFDATPPQFPRLPGRFAFLTVRLEGALPSAGESLRVRELTGSGPDFTFATGAEEYLTLRPGQSLMLSHAQSAPAFAHFLSEGFRHVLPLGWDHILFILAMFLLDRRLRPVLWQSLAFTVAHTVTLGLVMSGTVQPSPRVVEPLIALSIAAAAAENLCTSRVRPHRVALIFAFGLVHGLGFGGALAAVLQSSGGLTPLLAANLGVELAQVAILLAAALLFYFLPGEVPRTRTARTVNVLLVLAGLALLVQRLLP